jgi:hypothetical protein
MAGEKTGLGQFLSNNSGALVSGGLDILGSASGS